VRYRLEIEDKVLGLRPWFDDDRMLSEREVAMVLAFIRKHFAYKVHIHAFGTTTHVARHEFQRAMEAAA
jgi:hypothetical protein